MNTTTRDELAKRGMDWTVEKHQLKDDRTGRLLPLYGTFRGDTGGFLGGVVTDRYQPIQNDEALDVFPALNESGIDYDIKTMSSYNGGATVFTNVALPGFDFTVGPRQVGDIVGAGLMAKTSHDGSSQSWAMGWLNRFACTNGMILRMKMFVFAIRHTSKATDKLKTWSDAVHGIVAGVGQFRETASQLAELPIQKGDIGPIFDEVFGLQGKEAWDKAPRIQKRARTILDKYQQGTEFVAQRGTAWALYNAFTNYSDHDLTFRRNRANDDTDEQTRLRGILFGGGEALKFAAFNAIAARMNQTHNVKLPLMGAKVDD